MISQTALDLLFTLKNETKKIYSKDQYGKIKGNGVDELKNLSEVLYEE